jgi:predicted O-methyltransferase YrrM
MTTLKRLTDNHTVNFLRFALGLRGPASSVSGPERDVLARFARGKRCIIEVGVFEGATSRLFCQEIDPTGAVYLIDPFFPTVRLERMLNVSFNRIVATKAVKPWPERARFIRLPSRAAAETLSLRGMAEFIFIDARHEYEFVLEDFQSWVPMLAPGGAMAFHDSRVCDARGDIDESSGPVRLMREVGAGQHGPWQVVATADSVTVLRRAGEA